MRVVADTSRVAAQGMLVERLQEGDAAALGELYDQHAAALLAFARRLVGDADAAKDLVHEVFMTVPTAIQRFEGNASLRTFLISIAVNHARHHVRSAARRRAAGERLAREPEPSAAGTPEHHLNRERLAQALSSALDALPLDQRVAFVLCEVEERTSREAGEIVGAPEATMRTRLFHAKKKLREELERRGVR
ncbi:MAG: RNA polymerase sigma factor [Myxococcales bacterium]